MTTRIDELRARLNPIITSEIRNRDQELITSVRKVKDSAMKAGQPGGSRMGLAMEAVYQEELKNRIKIVWETVMQSIESFRKYEILSFSDDIKQFINEHIESIRVEMSNQLKQRTGKLSEENEILNVRYEMNDLCLDLLRSYSSKVDLWVMQKHAESKEIAGVQHKEIFKNIFEWVWRLFKLGAGK